jgi:hypothetical protein
MDADATGGTAPLVYSISNEPSGMTINSGTGVVSWTPTASPSQVGIYSVTVTVTDAAALTDSEVVQVTAETPLVNSPPVMNTIGKQLATNTVAWGIVAFATDPDGDTKTWTISGNPTWMSINSSTGAITGTPPNPGIWNVTVTCTATGGSDSKTFEVEVSTGTYYFGGFFRSL